MCDFALNSRSEVIKKKPLTKQFKLLGNDMDAKKWNSRRREVVYKVDWSDEEKRERCIQSVGAHVCCPPSCHPSIR